MGLAGEILRVELIDELAQFRLVDSWPEAARVGLDHETVASRGVLLRVQTFAQHFVQGRLERAPRPLSELLELGRDIGGEGDGGAHPGIMMRGDSSVKASRKQLQLPVRLADRVRLEAAPPQLVREIAG